MNFEETKTKIVVVIPCYKAIRTIGPVLTRIGSEVDRVYVVDDACPENTGKFVENTLKLPRIRVLYHKKNLGVGGAVITGYRAGLSEFKDDNLILLKVDADGQMDPTLIPRFVKPILQGRADYTKGNRFFDLEDLKAMPKIRFFGNSILSFVNKATSGYWNIMDPTNGFTAIHGSLLKLLPLEKISQTFFFESDMLFRIGCLRGVVKDIPMRAVYNDEDSHLKIKKITLEFGFKHLVAFFKRLFYRYYLRDFGIASVHMLLGIPLLLFGTSFGTMTWIQSAMAGTLTPTGTVFLAALPVILGIQLLLSALSYDILQEPKDCLHIALEAEDVLPAWKGEYRPLRPQESLRSH